MCIEITYPVQSSACLAHGTPSQLRNDVRLLHSEVGWFFNNIIVVCGHGTAECSYQFTHYSAREQYIITVIA